MSDYVTLEEASGLSHVAVNTLRKKIKLGLIPAFKPGKKVLILRRDLELYIKRTKLNSAV